MEKRNIFYTGGTVIFALLFYSLFLAAPADFPAGNIIRIEKGSNLRDISSLLKNDHMIKSRTAFEFFVLIFGGEKHIISADYLFDGKLPVFEIARRIATGEQHMPPVSVTIPEGFNLTQIADTFTAHLVNFNKAEFLTEAESKEGYLFPDTYFFLSTDNEKNVIDSMSGNFTKKITPILPEIISSGKNEKEVITMASVIEREAKGEADRAIISGILWHRVSIGMPLQVDAAPETYKTKGLPKSPIGNPGLLAIEASIHPQSSPYLYYLHDKNGNIHYAKTFTEHKVNEAKYLPSR